ncbi:PRC-barrel domain-containing protein [Actinoplanes sp. DH11]|uniref:PRC-barrel domain-containing protein n=1 Tax=Actinoplanes sp. DH11 TaxID=2857011 RepID=UPI001E4DF12F|nr:PRC-barrel domain-containing protein [Actinoplanes sp. DH11]
MTEKSEDLGNPVSYLVAKEGIPVYDRSGDTVGTLEHVLADEAQDVFHGLLIKTGDGHRFAGGDQVDGLFERGVIVSEPADQLATPAADMPAGLAENRTTALRKAWDWLIQPK